MFRLYILLVLTLGMDYLNGQEVSTFIERPGTQFEAITWGPNNQVYTVDFATGEVFKLNLTSASVEVIGTFNGALGGALDQAGNFYVSEFNTGNIIRIDSANQSTVFAEGLVGPAGILIDFEESIMYVANYFGNSISKINMQDSLPTPEVLASGGLINGPDGLVFSPEGDIISANFNNNNVQRITKAGEVSAFTQITSSINTGYLVKLEDRYLITGANGNDLYELTFTGDFNKIGGIGSAGNIDGPLEDAAFNFPNGIAVSPSGDSLLITESGAEGRIRLITGLNILTDLERLSLLTTLKVSPNPASGFIQLELTLNKPDSLRIQLLDMQGKLVKTLMREALVAGSFRQTFELDSHTPSGLYLIAIQVGTNAIQQQIVIE